MAQRIAIVGGGVAGLVAAHLLHGRYDVTVFEADERVGGHVRTIDVTAPDGTRHAVDMGFIVYNEQTYPLFTALLRRLGVESAPSDMSFGVRSDTSGVEYGSRSLAALLAQPSNALRPRFLAMVRDILRFHREAGPAVRNGASESTLGEYVRAGGTAPHSPTTSSSPWGRRCGPLHAAACSTCRRASSSASSRTTACSR